MKTLLLALAAVTTLASQQVAAGDMPASARFGQREAVGAADISPDGTKLVFIAPDGARGTRAVVANLANGAQQVALSAGGRPDRVSWCGFASDHRLLCQIRGELDSGGLLVPYARLLAIDIDGGNARPIGQRNSGYDARIRQRDAAVVDWLSGQDDNVLVAREYVPEKGKMNTRLVEVRDGTGVDRVNLATMVTETVEAPAKNADFYFSDGRGEVRMKGYTPVQGATGMLAGHSTYSYRLHGTKAWLPFSTSDEMVPLQVDAATNSAYVLKKLDGRQALYRVRLDGSLAAELVYKSDRVDVDGLVAIGRDRKAIGVDFADETRRQVYFDPAYATLAASLAKALPGTPQVTFLGASRDHTRLLVRTDGDTDPGRLYVFDRARKTLDPLLSVRPALEGVQLSKVRAITYPATDGTSIPAYLTLPPGISEAKGLPAIVLPHGGPSARDEGGFDWLAQYLAHEGYVVIQPNYRGSAGYGDVWRHENGFRGWKTSIGDVIDSARWLVKNGIADPDRLAVAGWSYGGYAALQASAVEPALFKAVVAIAPVTDLEMTKRESRDYTTHGLVVEQIGSGPHLREGSPLQNVSQIRAPVLLFHGDMDINVAAAQSRAMNKKLLGAGKSSELVEFAGLNHQLEDSESRAQMLERVSGFLKANVH